MKNKPGKVVLLTGASSGIGQAVAVRLAVDGFRIYGLTRKKELLPKKPGESGGFLQMIHGDITNDASVAAAVESVMEAEGRLDILINCAGIGIAGSIEDTSIEEAKVQFETCFFGPMRMCRQVLPIMRRQGGGQLINIGSVAEYIPIPFQSMYSASKYALESFTQALRVEVEPFNIRVSIVAPGDTKTNFTAARMYTKQSVTNLAYREQFKRALYAMVSYEMKGKNPDTVAKVVGRIIDKKNPPIRVSVCFEYKLIALGKRLFPLKWVDALYKKIYVGAKIPKNPIWDFEKEVLGENK